MDQLLDGFAFLSVGASPCLDVIPPMLSPLVGCGRARVAVVITGVPSILLADYFRGSVRDPLVDGSDRE